MKVLEDQILKRGKVLPGNILKVGSFLNQNIDTKLLSEMADEIYNHYIDKKITKVLTVESSGIALAVMVASKFSVDMVFAKKTQTANVDGELLSAPCYSFTHKKQNTLIVPKDYLDSNDSVLIVDDFLANGEAVNALIKIVKSIDAKVSGIAISIEKGFQGGGDKLRSEGYDLLSLAVIDEMNEGKIVFRK